MQLTLINTKIPYLIRYILCSYFVSKLVIDDRNQQTVWTFITKVEPSTNVIMLNNCAYFTFQLNNLEYWNCDLWVRHRHWWD